MDTATDVPKKRRALPFKRTFVRAPVNEPPPSHAPENNSDDDDPLAFFRRSKDVFPMALEDLKRAPSEEKVTPSESPKSAEHVNKKRRVSSNADGDNEALGASSSSVSAPSRTSASRVDSNDDDLIMDVKGKGKEIVRPNKGRLPTPRKPLSNTPRKLGTPSKKRFAFSDDEDDHGKDDLYSPHSKCRNPDRFSPKPTALGRSTRATNRGSSPLEGFETSFNLPGASSTSKRKPFRRGAPLPSSPHLQFPQPLATQQTKPQPPSPIRSTTTTTTSPNGSPKPLRYKPTRPTGASASWSPRACRTPSRSASGDG
ncbi:hypothetical protein SMACR_08570 [Sordaria macrospora]|uniref:Uncharacterized protein n=1 Tax=Sordaria macrospora TaxID=5147 RepID=A0A8S8ZX21_SORMA|nr:hypothetical protein SMACR_08570 [Sordaria macrospora]